MPRPKKPKGRPPKYTLPEPLDADLAPLVEVVLKVKPEQVRGIRKPR